MDTVTTGAIDRRGANLRVLYLDDSRRHRETARALLETAPIAVDFAQDIAEADQHVDSAQYDIVLVDVDLDTTEKSGRQGDDWLMMRYQDLKGADTYIVTAQKARIRNPAWLRAHNISVVEKGHGEVNLYTKFRVRASSSSRAATVSPLILVPTIQPNEVGQMIADRALGLFYDWIDRLHDGDIKDLYVEGRFYSPVDIKAAMKDRESPVGRTMLELFMDHVSDLLGFSSEEGQ